MNARNIFTSKPQDSLFTEIDFIAVLDKHNQSTLCVKILDKSKN